MYVSPPTGGLLDKKQSVTEIRFFDNVHLCFLDIWFIYNNSKTIVFYMDTFFIFDGISDKSALVKIMVLGLISDKSIV